MAYFEYILWKRFFFRDECRKSRLKTAPTMIILSDELDGIGEDLGFFAISLYKNTMPDGKL